MKTYDELKALIERRGVHAEFGDAGEGWGIEQNPHELATFLVAMQELGVQSVLEIGTGYKGGLSRFLAQDMGWRVTTVDVVDYGHKFEGVEYMTERSVPMDRQFDLVFIDGAHDLDSVSMDYGYYSYNAAKTVALHDVAGLRDCGGAAAFWKFLSTGTGTGNKRGYCTTIMDDSPCKAGIGWLTL